MSAQAGIFYFDRRPVHADTASALLNSLARFGPDGGDSFVAPGLVMVHQAMHVTPEDAHERQPVQSASGNVLTWDGRLDNRVDLLQRLRAAVGQDPSDARIALAACEAWGDEGAHELIGDFSFVLWNAENQTLRLASDFAGNRALYYWCNDQELHWSTSLGELVRRLDLDGNIDPAFVVGYLAYMMAPELTPYVGIHSVPVGHVVSWTRNGRRHAHRFWSPQASTVRFRDPRDYAFRLRDLFTDGVRGRLRASRTPWAELSGGLDSSTVCCTAHALVSQGDTPATELETISYISDSSPESDERRFAAVIEEQLGKTGAHLRFEDFAQEFDETAAWTTPLHPRNIGIAILRHVHAKGGRVLITGNPGDLIMGQAPDGGLSVLEQWRDNGSRSAFGHARRWARNSKQPIWELVAVLSRHALASKRRLVRSAMSEILTSRGTRGSGDVGADVQRTFMLPSSLVPLWQREIERRIKKVAAFDPIAKRPFVESLIVFTETRLLQTPAEFPHVLQTHAYIHRPLVEYVLSIPSYVLSGAHEHRVLMRAAFAEIVPARILARFSKGYPSPLLMRELKPLVPTLLRTFDQLELVQRGYVNPDLLKALLLNVRAGATPRLANLREIVTLEQWLVQLKTKPDLLARIPA